MMRLYFLFFLLIFGTSLYGQSPLFGGGKKQHVELNNRILAKVNGTPISLLDVSKKMDVLFYGQYPQYAEIPAAKHQFYEMNWERVLNDLIEKELLIADAQEMGLNISNGDIRQELEQMFGPNIIQNLDKAGLSFDDAWEIVKGDIAIRRILYFKVNNKIIRELTPKTLHDAYEEYLIQNPSFSAWEYQLISVRSEDPARGAEVAQSIYFQVNDQGFPIDSIKDKQEEGVQINVTNVEKKGEKELSENYLNILSNMEPGQLSEPVSQKSRASNETVYRIFYLHNVEQAKVIPFEEIAPTLKNQLLQERVGEETEKYIKRLKEHFHIETYIENKDDLHPFTLQ